jgi:hypothetical protein
VVLDSRFSVVQTYVAGQLVYAREPNREPRPGNRQTRTDSRAATIENPVPEDPV